MSSQERCGNCRLWGTEDDNNGVYRQCAAALHDEYGLAGKPLDQWTSEQEHRRINDCPAVAVDGSGYWAALRTRDDFGCVLFEPKPEATLTEKPS